MDQNAVKKLYESSLALFDRGMDASVGDTLETLESFRTLSADRQRLTFLVDREVNRLPHEESGEEMINLSLFGKEHGAQWVCVAGTTKYGAQDGKLLLRLSAARCLLEAEKNLRQLSDQPLTFLITDAYRPLSLQRQYFEQIKQELQEKEGLTGDALYEKAHMFIADPDIFPPHTTGGAIDLTVMDLSSGQALDMGTLVDEVDNPAIFSFYAHLSISAKQNRALLNASMTAAGFVNYPPEWWHFSYGDKEWALRTGRPSALYTPM